MAKPKLIEDIENLQTLTEGHTSQLADIATKHSSEIVNALYPPNGLTACKGNGVDSDHAAIVAMMSYLSSKGGGTLYFPPTTQYYVLTNDMSIPANVNMLGYNTKLYRTHNYQVSNSCFELLGNNRFEGFIFDGGLTRIANIGIQDEMTYYVDIVCVSDGVTIINNTFLNSKGTFIGGKGKAIISNNRFGDYGDHSVYMGGGSTSELEKILITNNMFTGTSASTRDCIKFRNTGSNIIISNNIFDLPYGTVFNFTLGDNANIQGTMKNVIFSNNIVKASNWLGGIYQTNTPIGQIQGTLENVIISKNTINSSSYLLIGGSVIGSDTNEHYFGNTFVDVSDNYFVKNPTVHCCCAGVGYGLKVRFKDNTIGRNDDSSYIFSTYGNTSLEIDGNTFNLPLDSNMSLIENPYNFSGVDNTKPNIPASSPQSIVIKNNIIKGIRKIFNDTVSKNVTYLTSNITFIIKDNYIEKNGLAFSVGLNDANVGICLAKMYEINNLYIKDGLKDFMGNNFPVANILATELFGSKTYDPPSIAAGAETSTTITISWATPGDCVQVSFSNNLNGIQLSGYVSATHTVTIVFRNNTASPIDLASGTLKARVIRF